MCKALWESRGVVPSSFGVGYFITKGLLKEVRKGMLAITRLLGDPGQEF